MQATEGQIAVEQKRAKEERRLMRGDKRNQSMKNRVGKWTREKHKSKKKNEKREDQDIHKKEIKKQNKSTK